jgi:hypothetical protein
MPLTAAKIAHIKGKLDLLHQGRSQQIVLTLKASDGSTSTRTVTGILRPVADEDPSFTSEGGGNTVNAKNSDAVMALKQADIDLPTLRSVVEVSYGNDATGAQPANRYRITGIDIKGIMPGGDRFVCYLERQGW